MASNFNRGSMYGQGPALSPEEEAARQQAISQNPSFADQYQQNMAGPSQGQPGVGAIPQASQGGPAPQSPGIMDDVAQQQNMYRQGAEAGMQAPPQQSTFEKVLQFAGPLALGIATGGAAIPAAIGFAVAQHGHEARKEKTAQAKFERERYGKSGDLYGSSATAGAKEEERQAGIEAAKIAAQRAGQPPIAGEFDYHRRNGSLPQGVTDLASFQAYKQGESARLANEGGERKFGFESRLQSQKDAASLEREQVKAQAKRDVSGTGNKPLTASQERNRYFAGMAQEAGTQLDNLGDPKTMDLFGSAARNTGSLIGEFFGDAIQTAHGREFHATGSRWINGILRKESGAAVPETEFKRYWQAFFPSPFDGPEQAQAKAVARDKAEEMMSMGTVFENAEQMIAAVEAGGQQLSFDDDGTAQVTLPNGSNVVIRKK